MIIVIIIILFLLHTNVTSADLEIILLSLHLNPVKCEVSILNQTSPYRQLADFLHIPPTAATLLGAPLSADHWPGSRRRPENNV